MSDKFFSGLRSYYIEYNKGVKKAEQIAESFSNVSEDGEVLVHIRVKGDNPSEFVSKLSNLGVRVINVSEYAPRVLAYVSIEDLEKLAEQSWVVSIEFPPQVIID